VPRRSHLTEHRYSRKCRRMRVCSGRRPGRPNFWRTEFARTPDLTARFGAISSASVRKTCSAIRRSANGRGEMCCAPGSTRDDRRRCQRWLVRALSVEELEGLFQWSSKDAGVSGTTRTLDYVRARGDGRNDVGGRVHADTRPARILANLAEWTSIYHRTPRRTKLTLGGRCPIIANSLASSVYMVNRLRTFS